MLHVQTILRVQEKDANARVQYRGTVDCLMRAALLRAMHCAALRCTALRCAALRSLTLAAQWDLVCTRPLFVVHTLGFVADAYRLLLVHSAAHTIGRAWLDWIPFHSWTPSPFALCVNVA